MSDLLYVCPRLNPSVTHSLHIMTSPLKKNHSSKMRNFDEWYSTMRTNNFQLTEVISHWGPRLGAPVFFFEFWGAAGEEQHKRHLYWVSLIGGVRQEVPHHSLCGCHAADLAGPASRYNNLGRCINIPRYQETKCLGPVILQPVSLATGYFIIAFQRKATIFLSWTL